MEVKVFLFYFNYKIQLQYNVTNNKCERLSRYSTLFSDKIKANYTNMSYLQLTIR